MGQLITYYLRGLYRELFEKPIFLWAQAVAFKVLIALVPLVLLATGVLGLFLRADRTFFYIERVIRDLVPTYGADELVTFLSGLEASGSQFTILGVLGIAITSLTLFTTLRTVLGHIFDEDWHEQRTLLQGYAFDFQMAVQTGFLLLGSIGITIFMQTVGSSGPGYVGLDGTWVSEGLSGGVQALLLILPAVLSTVMFFQLYWFIPKPRPPKRAAFAGALAASLLWEAAKVGLTVYASQFGLEGGWQTALGDTFMLILLVVIWAYYSGLVLCLGALVALLYERHHRIGPDREDHAMEMAVETASTELKTHVPE
ncbi:MAG: YihY/virulence factor BrkB family protein [Rhodothermales bacterium]|nr:YihY/virulence factor BrkB family protein [Rhodothermales bacterium]